MSTLQLYIILFTSLHFTTSVRLTSTREWYTVDLLQHVDWNTGCTANVRQPTTPLDPQGTAFRLADEGRRCIQVDSTFVRGHLQEILSGTEELTVLTVLKQQSNNTGTILAFTSDNKVLFEVESSGVRNELRVHYIEGQRSHLQVFPVNLADNKWHKLALTFTHSAVHVFVDCHQLYERQVEELDLSFINESTVQLWVTQRSQRHNQLKGSVEYVKIVTAPQGYLEQCPYADVACPTCNQFKSLESTVAALYTSVQELHSKLEVAERRLEQVESCECLQSCEVDGTRYRDGESWNLDYCTKCTCKGGEVECAQPKCPVLNCKNPVLLDGHCCPTCLKRCYAGGTYYEHGEGFQPEDRVCVDCTCGDGKMQCKHRTCPPLDCPAYEQREIQGECCKVCRNSDFCAAGNNCHVNANCHNLETTYACSCKEGFHGDGTHCEDIDECALGGHCHGHSTCRNTIGDYECVCDEGYVPETPTSCRPLDACADTAAVCGANAVCVNSRTSFSCECLPGYQGDGQTCTPVCSEGCVNGGRCVSPGVCQCRKGFVGTRCQEDLDECSLGLSRCYANSKCVNTPGSYHCACQPGYHSDSEDNRQGWLCRDVDECAGQGSGHTCALGTECRNTEGSYECVCLDPRVCQQPCRTQYGQMQHGMTRQDPMDSCSTCTCKNGEYSCKPKACDCSDPNVDLSCCQQCEPEAECRHQELPFSYKSGQQWMYHCQSCTCMNGQRECSPVECPALDCSPAVQIEGDCCPRCMHETDACAVTEAQIRPNEICVVNGRTYLYGQHFHMEKLDRCTTCTCKNGHICCSYNQTCMQQRVDQIRELDERRRTVDSRDPRYIDPYYNDQRLSYEQYEDAYRWNIDRQRRKDDRRDIAVPIEEDYVIPRGFDASRVRDTGQDYSRNSQQALDRNQNPYIDWQDFSRQEASRPDLSQSFSDSRARHDRARTRNRRDGIRRRLRNRKT